MLDHDEPRAFYNVCQHRGHTLVMNESGCRKLFTCPYHSWSYGLNGKLKMAPNTQDLEGFDREKISLTPIRLENYCGFLFVNLDADAATMETIFPSLKERILNACPDIEKRYFVHQHSAQEHCNWLLAVENYNECYHCKVVHKDFAQGVIDPESYQILPIDSLQVLHHQAQFAKGEHAWYEAENEAYNSFFLWPGCSIQIYPGGLVNTYHWRPIAPTQSIVYRSWFATQPKIDETLQKVIDLDRTSTFIEDIELLNNVQRGLGSRGYKPGPLVCHPKQNIDSEHSVACIHEWIRQAQEKYAV